MKLFFLFLLISPTVFAQNAERCLNDQVQMSLFMHMKKDIAAMNRDCSKIMVNLLSEYELKKNQLLEYKLRAMGELREGQVKSQDICKKSAQAKTGLCSDKEEKLILKHDLIQKDYKQTCIVSLELIRKFAPESRCGEEKLDLDQIVTERPEKHRVRAFDLNDEMDVKTKSLEYKDE